MKVVNGINLQAIQSLVMAKAERAVGLGAQHVLTESRPLSPLEEGTLERSSGVDTEVTGTTARASIHYDTVYAPRQHEETTWRHPRRGQAKYLEQPMHAEAATVGRIVQAQVRLE